MVVRSGFLGFDCFFLGKNWDGVEKNQSMGDISEGKWILDITRRRKLHLVPCRFCKIYPFDHGKYLFPVH